jgi:hypothetical protein
MKAKDLIKALQGAGEDYEVSVFKEGGTEEFTLLGGFQMFPPQKKIKFWIAKTKK